MGELSDFARIVLFASAGLLLAIMDMALDLTGAEGEPGRV